MACFVRRNLAGRTRRLRDSSVGYGPADAAPLSTRDRLRPADNGQTRGGTVRWQNGRSRRWEDDAFSDEYSPSDGSLSDVVSEEVLGRRQAAAGLAAAAAAELGEGRSDHAIDKYGEAIRLLEAALAEVNADGEGQERSPQAVDVVRLRGGHNIILHGRLTL